MIFLFTACGENEYPPVESTKEESETVMTLSFAGESYKIPYELYRTFFLQLRDSVDGGDRTVWTSSEKDTYVEKINEMILSRIAEIYAVFYLCKEAGIDPYSKETDKLVEEYIKVSVEGGDLGGVRFEGFDGNYDAYLASLEEMYVNYSVSDLFIRYTLALEELNVYYAGKETNNPADAKGAIEYTKDDVRDFYYGEDSVRVLRAFLPSEAFTKERANEIRGAIAAKEGESAVANYMIGYTLSGGQDIKNGEIIGIRSLDARYYNELTDAAFSLEIGETSELISLNTEIEVGYVIIYRAQKSDAHYESCYDDIAAVYVQNEIGNLIHNTEQSLIASAAFTKAGKEINHSIISMK